MTGGANSSPRREQIIGIAAELFDRYGYHETSMQSIADRAGVRKASLYYYFKKKEDILVELHEALMSVVITRQEERVAADQLGPREQLRAMMRDVIGLMESHPGHLRIFFESYRELPAEVRSAVAGQRSRYRGMLTDVLVTGVAEGQLSTPDPELTAIAVLSLMNWTYQWFRRSGPRTTDEVADYFWDLLLHGIGPGHRSQGGSILPTGR